MVFDLSSVDHNSTDQTLLKIPAAVDLVQFDFIDRKSSVAVLAMRQSLLPVYHAVMSTNLHVLLFAILNKLFIRSRTKSTIGYHTFSEFTIRLINVRLRILKASYLRCLLSCFSYFLSHSFFSSLRLTDYRNRFFISVILFSASCF